MIFVAKFLFWMIDVITGGIKPTVAKILVKELLRKRIKKIRKIKSTQKKYKLAYFKIFIICFLPKMAFTTVLLQGLTGRTLPNIRHTFQ